MVKRPWPAPPEQPPKAAPVIRIRARLRTTHACVCPRRQTDQPAHEQRSRTMAMSLALSHNGNAHSIGVNGHTGCTAVGTTNLYHPARPPPRQGGKPLPPSAASAASGGKSSSGHRPAQACLHSGGAPVYHRQAALARSAVPAAAECQLAMPSDATASRITLAHQTKTMGAVAPVTATPTRVYRPWSCPHATFTPQRGPYHDMTTKSVSPNDPPSHVAAGDGKCWQR